jgi:SAM-dependent methyltransferase
MEAHVSKTYLEFNGRLYHERADRDAYELSLSMMENVRPGRVLDLAAGSGYTTARLAAMGFSPTAYDINAEQFVPVELPFVKVNLNEGIPEADASVEGVLALEVIEHLENPRAFLREVARVVAPNGALVLSTPNIVSIKSKFLFMFREELQLFFNAERRVRDPFCDEASGHITSLLPWLLAVFLDDVGFTIELKSYTKTKRFGVRSRHFGRSLILFAKRRGK